MSSKPVDPLVEEVRERGRSFTAKFDNDVHKIFEHFRQHKKAHPDQYVSQIKIVSENHAANSAKD